MDDILTVRALLARYLTEYSRDGFDRESFLDWVATQAQLFDGDVHALIALYERRVAALRRTFPAEHEEVMAAALVDYVKSRTSVERQERKIRYRIYRASYRTCYGEERWREFFRRTVETMQLGDYIHDEKALRDDD